MTIESPCIRVCVIDPASGLCAGCGRTGSEIGAWVSMSAGQRRDIMASLTDRLKSMPGREGRCVLPRRRAR